MREILFRGKRLDNGEWIEGCLRQYPNGCAGICCNKMQHTFRVDPETVGQYTGLTDADGCPIFEGDMFEPCDDEFDKSIVEFREGAFRVITYGTLGAMTQSGWDETAGGYGETDEHDLLDWIDCGVIGNIHDNPELLKGAE